MHSLHKIELNRQDAETPRWRWRRVLATDANQMHTDKNQCKLHLHLCASDFYLWQISHFSASWQFN